MGEVLLWTIAVFAVLGGPPLLIVWRERRRVRREACQREQQRCAEEAHGQQQPQSDGTPSSSIRVLPGVLLAVWTL